MDHNAYNKHVVSHFFTLFAESELDRWHALLDTRFIDHSGLKKAANPDGTLVLNFYPEAVRDLQLATDCITVNMALQGRRTHVVIPYESFRGGFVEIDGEAVFIPAAVYVNAEAPPEEPEQEEKPKPVVDGNIITLFPQVKK